ncbi:universal stress protein UspA-like protein [Belliella baltica DSM 15883]|uniref:Universal stress protein UspA-like protein n=1 Tax=Belliella baltica (strain DSM 15883 / CIP 108006 / LMG 21964 / BA134) TaxID=866536 RepID=I3Z6M6_BELBD|nr:universal stress protein [Belliella baltica]AFL84894.1 universal stress protein UspA-like protein [Belliella baltica DSM 15883]
MKILVPTDFSENANNALTFAKHMAKSQGEVQITLLFAFYAVYDFASNVAQIVDSIESDAKKAMKRAVELALDEGLQIDYKILQGTVSSTITSMAYREDYDLIIMGTQGANGINKTLFGSNTAHVIKESQVPVISVPNEAKWEHISKIVVGSELDQAESKFYKKLLKITSKLLFPYEFVHVDFDRNQEFQPNFEALENQLRAFSSSISFITKTIQADAVLTGIEESLSNKYDALLVMFYKKKSFFEYLFDESDSVKMLYHTHLPLLILK